MAVSSAFRSGGDGDGRLCGPPGDLRRPWPRAGEEVVSDAVTAGVGLGALQVKLAVALEFVCPLLLGVSHYNQASPKWDRWVKRVMTAVRGPLPGSSQIRGIAERFPPRGGPAGFSAAHARALSTHPQIGLTWTRSWVCFFKTSYFPILFVPEI